LLLGASVDASATPASTIAANPTAKDPFAMKSRIAIATALFGTLVASPAFADDGSTPPPAAAPAAEVEASAPAAKAFSIGAQLELQPAGSMDTTLSGPVLNGRDSDSTQLAYGISGNIGYDVASNVSIGFVPRLVFGVKADSATGDAAKEVDVHARVTLHGEVAPLLQIYGFAAPGYAWVIPTKGDTNFGGFAMDVGAGATYDVSSALFVSAEVGYQLAFVSADVESTHAEVDMGYFRLGLGAGTRF
jgi:hypothetical protein